MAPLAPATPMACVAHAEDDFTPVRKLLANPREWRSGGGAACSTLRSPCARSTTPCLAPRRLPPGGALPRQLPRGQGLCVLLHHHQAEPDRLPTRPAVRLRAQDLQLRGKKLPLPAPTPDSSAAQLHLLPSPWQAAGPTRTTTRRAPQPQALACGEGSACLP